MAAYHCPKCTLRANRTCEPDLQICGVSYTAHLASVLVQPLLFWFFGSSLASQLLLRLLKTAQTRALGEGCVYSPPHDLWPRFWWMLQNHNHIQTIYIQKLYVYSFFHAGWQGLDCSSQICSLQTCISLCLAGSKFVPGESSVCQSVYHGRLGTSGLCCRVAPNRQSIGDDSPDTVKRHFKTFWQQFEIPND